VNTKLYSDLIKFKYFEFNKNLILNEIVNYIKETLG